MKTSKLLSALALAVITAYAFAQDLDNKLLPGSILGQPAVPDLAQQEQVQNRRIREYPLKAPTIPHVIEGFQINQNLNQCLTCHAHNIAPMMKAPAIGVSHYANRNGEYLANISPRRYFCNLCHVPQTTGIPLVTSVK